jgi:cardiolipin synthase
MLDGLLPLWLLVIDWTLRLALAGHIILKRRPVTTSLAWLVVLVFVPIFGLFVYFLVGETRLGRRRWTDFDRLSKSMERDAVAVWRHQRALDEQPEREWSPIARFGTAISGFPPVGADSGKLSFLNDSAKFLDRLITDIENAKHHCHILTYIWTPYGKPVEVAEALIRAAQRGVTCRLLLDAVGCKAFLRSPQSARMQAAGVKLVPALPVNPLRMLLARIDLRNHRKIAVIDGRIGYAGSQNLTDSTFRSKKWRNTGSWIDASVRLEGPASQALALVFLRDWLMDSDESITDFAPFLPDVPTPPPGNPIVQVVPSGPGPSPDAIRQAMLTTIYSAREEIVMTTPYFVPDDATRVALQAAATRGVAVTLVMPKVSDSLLVAAASRSHYVDLLESGVKILHYNGGLLHAKTLSIDRRIALIGSANFDQRSFFLNFEVTLFIYDDDSASMMRFMQTSYMENSTEVLLADWRQRAIWRVFIDNAAQLLGPLL